LNIQELHRLRTAANDNWKERMDLDRPAEEERVLELRRSHVVRRARAFTWKVPANDNQSWPLLAQLRKDGKEALVSIAERYRATYDRATRNGLQGVDVESNTYNVVPATGLQS
jgi:hypothetical protein